MKKLVLGVTVGGSSRLLDGQVSYFKSIGYDVYLVSQDHFKEQIFCEKEGCTHLPVTIEKDINPIQDLKTLRQIIRHFKRINPQIINVGTPKMGLLGLMAAKYLGIKTRIYTCRGLRFETEKGVKRAILLSMERLTVELAKKVIYVSPSLMCAAIKSGACIRNKSIVIGKGSSNGVNLMAFDHDFIDKEKRGELITQYQLTDKTVIGFVGRVTLHKGSYELVEAFERIHQEHPDTVLIMIGHLDCSKEFELKILSHPAITHIPFQNDVPLYMSLFDMLVLPSWREGFPNVPIQAAAMGIPVIVSDATGCVDSVCDNWNGKIFKLKSVDSLTDSLRFYVSNPALRLEHGTNGILWSKNFRSENVWDGIENVYQSCV